MKKSQLIKVFFSLGLLAFLSETASAKEVKYTSQDLRDPFRSPFEMEAYVEEEKPTETPVGYDLSHLQVQGMVWGTKMPQAIINNNVVRIGEIIDGAEILDIRKEGIYVLYEGGQYIIRPKLAK